MRCLKYLLLAYFSISCGLSNSLNGQSPDQLDNRNGFKDIKMMSEIHQYNGLEFKEEIEDEVFGQLSVYQRKKGYYGSIGTVKIHNVLVYTYKDAVYRIHVVTEKNPKLFAGLKKVFGKPTFSPRGDNYYWSGKKLGLTFGKHKEKNLQLVYTSYLVKKKLKKDKEDEIESISNDF